MISVGGIVSVGGSGGGGGGGSSSGITSINGATGPSVTLAGVSGISVVPSGNTILIGGESVQGTGGGSSSQSGVLGVNGIDVEQVGGNFVVDGAALSGLVTYSNQYSATFTNITSGIFNHNLGTRDVIVQVRDNGAPPREIIPDAVVYDTLDDISLIFNVPVTGRVTIIGSGVSCTLSQDQIIDSRRYALLVS